MSAAPAPRDFAALLDARFVGDVGRRDRYLVERAGRVETAKEPLNVAVWEEHALGAARVGAFQGERTLFAGLDFDGGHRDPNGRKVLDPVRHEAARASTRDAARILRDVLALVPLVERTRSGFGYRGLLLFDPADPPTLANARTLVRGVLRLAGLPDGGDESKSEPGVFPRPPGAEGVGGTCFAPCAGACNGAKSSAILDPDTLAPLLDQFGALAIAQRYTAEDVATALDCLATRLEERGLALPEEGPPKLYAPVATPESATDSPYFLAALRRECAALGAVPAGQNRNAACFVGAARLGNIIGAGAGTVETAEAAFLAALDRNGYSEHYGEKAALRVLRRGLSAGIATPREIPPPPEPEPAADFASREPAWIREEYDEPAEGSTVASESERNPSPDADAIPELPVVCWRGGFASFRAAFGRCTEAANAYLFGAYLVLASLALGRQARLRVGFNVFPNVFVVLVGESGRSRKSTAQGFGRSMLREVDEGVIHSLGVGSPEGLVKLFADDAHRPRRVLLDLGELATLLRKGAAEATRGLLPLIVDLYDCPPAVRLPNAKADVEGREPFLCILAGSTVEWIAASLSVEDARAGFAGRFMIFTGSPKPAIPWPPPPDITTRDEALGTLRAARDRHAVERVYPLAEAARDLWADWYNAERARAYPSETLEVVAQRLPLFAWKLALVYAALEESPEVTREQLEAAIAFADYQRDAQRLVLGGLGDSLALRVEDRIRAALLRHGPLPPWRLSQIIRRVPAETLARALRNLGLLGVIEQRRQGRCTAWALASGQEGQGLAKGKAKG